MIAIERILRREHDIGPIEINNFSIRDWGQALDLKGKLRLSFLL